MPQWLRYTLLAILAYGAWGAVSSLESQNVSALTLQIVSTIGLFPVALVLVFSKNLGRGANRSRGILLAVATGMSGRHRQPDIVSNLARGRRSFRRFSSDQHVPVGHNHRGQMVAQRKVEPDSGTGHCVWLSPRSIYSVHSKARAGFPAGKISFPRGCYMPC